MPPEVHDVAQQIMKTDSETGKVHHREKFDAFMKAAALNDQVLEKVAEIAANTTQGGSCDTVTDVLSRVLDKMSVHAEKGQEVDYQTIRDLIKTEATTSIADSENQVKARASLEASISPKPQKDGRQR